VKGEEGKSMEQKAKSISTEKRAEGESREQLLFTGYWFVSLKSFKSLKTLAQSIRQGRSYSVFHDE
jgi:hypothetical protein